MKMKKQEKQQNVKLSQKIDINSKTFKNIMIIYEKAMTETVEKLQKIKSESKKANKYNLIEEITYRIKKPESILNKMGKKHYKLTYKQMVQHINDIAGIRIICPLKKDIFLIKELIENIPEINVIKEKDYVTYPKESGYSSFHQIIEVPTNLNGSIVNVKIEIQIRTIAMDFWANLEHKIKYKPEKVINNKISKDFINSIIAYKNVVFF